MFETKVKYPISSLFVKTCVANRRTIIPINLLIVLPIKYITTYLYKIHLIINIKNIADNKIYKNNNKKYNKILLFYDDIS